MTAQIQELRFDQSPWRLDCLDGLHDAELYRHEPCVEVHLSELAMRQSDAIKPLQLQTHE